MNVTLQQTPMHRTRDGHAARYVIARDSLTTRRVAMLQVVTLEDGGTQYRDTEKNAMPAEFTFSDALRFALAHDSNRRAERPSQFTQSTRTVA